LSELVPLGDPPKAGALAKLRRYVAKTAAGSLGAVLDLGPTRVVGSSGSIHALAHVDEELEGRPPLEQLNGHVLRTEELERTLRQLARMKLSDREKLPGLAPKRAEIIVHGAVVLLHVLEKTKAEGVVMSDFGVREGLLVDYIASHAREITALDKIEDLKLRSVLGLLARFGGDEAHSRHVTELSLALFDALTAEHGLGEEERRLLHYAALVHDIGSTIGHDNHTEHSYYIIKHGNLRGLSAEEIEVMALVARYHGKARPKKGDPAYASLKRKTRKAVAWLASMLRIAEALDRSQYQLVQRVRVTRNRGAVTIRAAAREDARLEVWAARQRTPLLSRLLGKPVAVVLEPDGMPPAGGKRPGPGPARAARPRPRDADRGPSPANRLGRTPPPVVPARRRAGNGR
jgi:exopolyphosphatase/guanosine-5'-triphosphate,3'-diphosphate pyrophosphatase